MTTATLMTLVATALAATSAAADGIGASSPTYALSISGGGGFDGTGFGTHEVHDAYGFSAAVTLTSGTTPSIRSSVTAGIEASSQATGQLTYHYRYHAASDAAAAALVAAIDTYTIVLCSTSVSPGSPAPIIGKDSLCGLHQLKVFTTITGMSDLGYTPYGDTTIAATSIADPDLLTPELSRHCSNDGYTDCGAAAFALAGALEAVSGRDFYGSVTLYADARTDNSSSAFAFIDPVVTLAAGLGVDPANYTLAFSPNLVGGSVPEPAAWLLMVVGFGVVGALARTRQRSVTA